MRTELRGTTASRPRRELGANLAAFGNALHAAVGGEARKGRNLDHARSVLVEIDRAAAKPDAIGVAYAEAIAAGSIPRICLKIPIEAGADLFWGGWAGHQPDSVGHLACAPPDVVFAGEVDEHCRRPGVHAE